MAYASSQPSAAVAPPAHRSQRDVLAVVNGDAISLADFEHYAAVFETPDQRLRVAEEQVLLSLINQRVTEAEASRRGIVVTDDDVSVALNEMMSVALIAQSIEKDGDLAAVRQRVRMFVLFRRVADAVVGDVEVSAATIAAEYEADPQLRSVTFELAAPVLAERIREREVEMRWAQWLENQRACATVVVLDASFRMESPRPRSCASPNPLGNQ